jgi:capsular polysaccharide biosynthesis protein
VAAQGTDWRRNDASWDAEPMDVSRHLAALKRARGLIVVMVVSMTAAVFVLSTFMPKTYEARARIVVDDQSGAFASGDVATVQRRLATVQELLTTRRVLAGAADQLRLRSPDTLQDKVGASVDHEANIVNVTATDDTPAGAASIANTVARTFLAAEAAEAQQRLGLTRAQLLRAFDRSQNPAERTAIRQRLSELSVSGAASSSDLTLAEPARAPESASSPRPVRNAVFAFFGAAFLAVLAAVVLGQFAPRLTGPRELSTVVGAPLVAALPARAGRRGERGSAEPAYGELRSSLAGQLPGDLKVVVVAGDVPGFESAAVTTALARTLADEGGATLVVSADLRRPRVHEILGVDRAPGLAEVVESLRTSERESAEALIERAVVSARTVEQDLDVLPAGAPTETPSQLLANEATDEFFAALENLDYRHVVVEGPALLGAVDGPLVARHADAVLAVCQLDRLTPANAAEIGDLLRRAEAQFVGLISIGGDAHARSVAVTPWPRELPSRIEA